MSTKYDDKKEHLWMSSRGAFTGVHMKANRTTKGYAMDGSNSLKFSLGDPILQS